MNCALDANVQSGGTARRENRRSPRPNLLLAAAIEADGLTAPVRIRNLSERGALVEGPALPSVGTRLILRRLEVEISGRVVWAAAPRCGIEFDGHVTVAEWISGKKSAETFGQTRVDTIQAAIRAGAAVLAPAPAEAIGSELTAQLDGRLAEELLCLRRLLETMGDALTDEPIVVQRHAALLQNFDLAAQVLGHVAAVLTAGDRAAAVDAIGMNELRARLTRRAISGG